MSPVCAQVWGAVGGFQVSVVIHIAHTPIIIISFLLLFTLNKKKAVEDFGRRTLVSEFLAEFYPWTKALHVVSVIAWMAGLFYLPRLFVYHTEEVVAGSETDLLFQVMERKLLRLIMNPAMTSTWIFGLALVFTPGIVDWSEAWPWVKAASVLAMTWFHHWLGYRRKDFAAGRNIRTGRRYRMMNEVPTVFMVLIVVSVIVKF